MNIAREDLSITYDFFFFFPLDKRARVSVHGWIKAYSGPKAKTKAFDE